MKLIFGTIWGVDTQHELREQLKFAIYICMYSKILIYTLVTISGITHTKRCGNIILSYRCSEHWYLPSTNDRRPVFTRREMI
jgi:hypothetical protein